MRRPSGEKAGETPESGSRTRPLPSGSTVSSRQPSDVRLAKTRRLPSRDQEGWRLLEVSLTMAWAPLPSARTSQTWKLGEKPPVYASQLPSGDQAGPQWTPGPVVSWTRPPPSGRMVQICDEPPVLES